MEYDRHPVMSGLHDGLRCRGDQPTGINCAVYDPLLMFPKTGESEGTIVCKMDRAELFGLPFPFLLTKSISQHQTLSVHEGHSKSWFFRDCFRWSINNTMPDAGLFSHDENKPHAGYMHSGFFDSELVRTQKGAMV